MLNETTLTKLYEMRLSSMAESFRQQIQDPTYNALAFEERIGLMVDIEWARRKNNKLAKLIRKADLNLPEACLENIEYHVGRKLDKAQITRLSTCAYIQDMLLE
ncbi:ATP-binding protein [Desulfitobacterium hafniense]|uniref:ATP-binding protein n=1 Tax=Desulfitobacterium hafniense TaxID=49338 RepID=UPI0002DB67C5|nr:ATP-binding protein [Desulfitobacterium hafniense]